MNELQNAAKDYFARCSEYEFLKSTLKAAQAEALEIINGTQERIREERNALEAKRDELTEAANRLDTTSARKRLLEVQLADLDGKTIIATEEELDAASEAITEARRISQDLPHVRREAEEARDRLKRLIDGEAKVVIYDSCADLYERWVTGLENQLEGLRKL